jgi:hypothetical protein
MTASAPDLADLKLEHTIALGAAEKSFDVVRKALDRVAEGLDTDGLDAGDRVKLAQVALALHSRCDEREARLAKAVQVGEMNARLSAKP